jgi:hypothetical protein
MPVLAAPVTVILEGAGEAQVEAHLRASAFKVSTDQHRRVLDLQTAYPGDTGSSILEKTRLLFGAAAHLTSGTDSVVIFVGDISNADRETILPLAESILAERTVKLVYSHLPPLSALSIDGLERNICAVGFSGGNDVSPVLTFGQSFWGAVSDGFDLDDDHITSLFEGLIAAAQVLPTGFTQLRSSAFSFVQSRQSLARPLPNDRLFENLQAFLTPSSTTTVEIQAHKAWSASEYLMATDSFLASYRAEARSLRRIRFDHGGFPWVLRPLVHYMREVDFMTMKAVSEVLFGDLAQLAYAQSPTENPTAPSERSEMVTRIMGGYAARMARMRSSYALMSMLNKAYTFWNEAGEKDRAQFERLIDCEMAPL